MFNLGMGEITVILLLAIIFLGPKKLPDLASGLGKIIRDIRKATSDVKNEIALDETFRKPFEELRDAVTLHPDELKRRDQLKQSLEDIRKRAEAVEADLAAVADGDAANAANPAGDGPSPVTPSVSAAFAAVDGPAEDKPSEAPSADVPPPPPHAPLFSMPAAKQPTTPPSARRPTPAMGIHAPPPAPPPAVASPGQATHLPGHATHLPGPATHPPGHATHPPGHAVPSAPPPGTVSAPPTRLGPPRVTPPVSSVATSDRSNTTQSLTEEDLLAASGLPTPPPHKVSPPPLPGIVKPPPVPPGPKKA